MITILGILLIVLLAFFYPRKGLYYFLKTYKKEKERVKIENALKYIYDREYEKGSSCTVEAIAGNFNMSVDTAVNVVKELETMNLIQTSDRGILLEPVGKNYALRIIRTHRLWEKYLAEETSASELEWHEKAEHAEHKLTAEEVEKLAARIGNPLVDPHGDPIPTADGEIRKLGGMPFSKMKNGEVGKVVHVEDEPKAIYSQLVALGIHKGMQIEVLYASNEKIRFLANGKEAVLAPSFANNITVKKIDKGKQKEDFKSLDTLKLGEIAEVIGVSDQLRGQQRRRLMDFGILPGTSMKVGIISPFGDPTGYIVRETTIALRKDQANKIFIKVKGVAA